MSEQQNQPPFTPPVSVFTGPVAELIAQRMLLPPSRPGLLAVLDHFEILRILGGGGMGIVLLARDLDTGRDVAIKLVKSELVTNQHVIHRFLKEAGHLKRLRHTNIVPVQEISDRTEGPYFVMPYFEKGSLANRIKPGQPLDRAAAIAPTRSKSWLTICRIILRKAANQSKLNPSSAVNSIVSCQHLTAPSKENCDVRRNC